MTADAPSTVPPLRLRDYSRTVVATGLTARNVRELRERVDAVPASSLFHHFWGRLLRAGSSRGEYGNDLAEWVAHRLEDAVLAERLALVDPIRLADMEELREELCRLLEARIEEVNGRVREVAPDEAFHFVSGQLVVYATDRIVERPEDLPGVLDDLPHPTLFLHFVDPPGLGVDGAIGMAPWIRSFGQGYEGLATVLESLDVFLMSPEELRQRIRMIFEEHLGRRAAG